MIKYEDILISEVINDKSTIRLLRNNNLITMDDLVLNIEKIEYTRGIGVKRKIEIYDLIKKYLNNDIVVNRTIVSKSIKNIFINEMGYSNYVVRLCRREGIKTLEDIHYLIDRNLIDTIDSLKNHKDEIITIYNDVISNKMIINRLFNDRELSIIKKYKNKSLIEFNDFIPVMYTAFKFSNINTIGDLADSLLSERKIRLIDNKFKPVLIKIFKKIICELELSNEYYKKL